MGKSVFSVPIFFIVFRETLEAAIIVSVLLGLVEQIASEDNFSEKREAGSDQNSRELTQESDAESAARKKRFIRRMRIQIFAGSSLGFFIALAIGAAFIAVWFTKASNLWANAEELWEGIFELIASLMIFVMGITMLKMDRAKAKWRVKLQRAFEGQHVDSGARSGKWVLFILPLITVLREGMEAVVFVGGVSLGQPATSIPLATVVGLVCGLICGFLIYSFASRTTLTIFLVVMTNLLLLIGAGLFSRSIGSFQENTFNHLRCRRRPWLIRRPRERVAFGLLQPREHFDNNGWSIFNAIFGWTNNATLGTVLGYVFYWIAAVVVLIVMKYKEGRTKLFGRESEAGVRRRERAALHRGDSEIAEIPEKE
ncbi:Ftr1 protein [Cytidiella melzeri]|nr:Ftr1 protein [Cytidiella melzeri]